MFPLLTLYENYRRSINSGSNLIFEFCALFMHDCLQTLVDLHNLTSLYDNPKNVSLN